MAATDNLSTYHGIKYANEEFWSDNNSIIATQVTQNGSDSIEVELEPQDIEVELELS